MKVSLSGRLANLGSRYLDPLARWSGRNHTKKFLESGGTRMAAMRGMPVFCLHVVGRSSGEPRPVMLMLIRRGDDLLVCGSNGGNPATPNWYRNLMAAGGGSVTVGADTWTVTAREVEGPEREACWQLLRAGYPDFDSYQALTDRQLPVAVLEDGSAGRAGARAGARCLGAGTEPGRVPVAVDPPAALAGGVVRAYWRSSRGVLVAVGGHGSSLRRT